MTVLKIRLWISSFKINYIMLCPDIWTTKQVFYYQENNKHYWWSWQMFAITSAYLRNLNFKYFSHFNGTCNWNGAFKIVNSLAIKAREANRLCPLTYSMIMSKVYSRWHVGTYGLWRIEENIVRKCNVTSTRFIYFVRQRKHYINPNLSHRTILCIV